MTKKTLKVVISTLTLTFILSGCAKRVDSPVLIPEEPVETPSYKIVLYLV